MIYYENIVNVTIFFLLLPRFRNNFFSPQFSAMPLPQLLQFFFSYFDNGIAAISLSHFFFFSLWALHAHFIPGQQELDRGISIFTLLKFNIFSLLPFSSSLSYFLLNFGNGDTETQSLSSQS